MGLLTFDPRPLVAGLLGMGAMGSRRGSNRGVASSERPGATFRKPAPFGMDGMRAMGLPPFVRLPRPPKVEAERDQRRRPSPSGQSGEAQQQVSEGPRQEANPRPENPALQPQEPPDLPTGVDWDFIIGEEGNELGGYVPKSGKSGVTIAAGLDLGQHSEADLRRMGIPEHFIRKFAPYLGPQPKRGASELRISPEEADQINRWVFTSFYRSTAAKYDAASKQGDPFKDLPREAQTAILDLAHQYGPNFERETPRYWGLVTSGDWEGAVRELENFGDEHADRREREAALLRKALESGTLKNRPDSR